jgi:hypothetical protein
MVSFTGEALADLLIGHAPRPLVEGMPSDSQYLYAIMDSYRDILRLVFATSDPSIPETPEGDPYYTIVGTFTRYDSKASTG